MPDITMCTSKYCRLKNMCYRYLAIPNEYRQSYCDFSVNDNYIDCFILSLHKRIYENKLKDSEKEN
jgi:hypothetical protein